MKSLKKQTSDNFVKYVLLFLMIVQMYTLYQLYQTQLVLSEFYDLIEMLNNLLRDAPSYYEDEVIEEGVKVNARY